MVIVYNSASNGNVWYAGYDDQAPQVGVGAVIPPGEVEEIECTDANLLSFIPETDGNAINVIVLGNSGSAQVTPSDPPGFTTTPPTLTPIQPNVNPATNFPTFIPIIVQASAALDATTINNTTVTASPTMTATISQNSSDPTKINVTPTVALSLNTSYTITYGTGIKDQNGNALAAPYHFTFTTVVSSSPPDTTPPTVLSANPGGGTSNVNPSLVPTITFSEAMQESSFTTTNIIAFLTANNQKINGLFFTLSTDLTTLSINGMNLTTSTTYQITIEGGTGIGPTDLSGNYLAASYNIPFATAPSAATVIYSVAGNSYDILQASNGYVLTGILTLSNRSLLVGQVPTAYTFILHKVGAPTGTISFNWYRPDRNGDFNLFRTIGTISATIIPTTDQTITINDSGNTSPIAYHDLICIEYHGGNSSNYIAVKVSNFDAFDGSNTINDKLSSNGNELQDFDSVDLAGTISVASGGS